MFLYKNWLVHRVIVGTLLSCLASFPCFAEQILTIQAEAFSANNGVALEDTSDLGGGKDIGWIDANDWAEYNVNPSVAGWYKIDVRVASTINNAGLVFRQHGQEITPTIVFNSTGGWQNWTTVSSRVYLSAGLQSVQLLAKTNGFNVNWFSITPESCSNLAAITIPGQIEAEAYCGMQGVAPENTSDTGGGQNLGWLDAGDWVDFRVNVPTAGTYTLKYRYASTVSNAQLSLLQGTTLLGTSVLQNTGGWQTWQTQTSTVSLGAGAQTLRVRVDQPGFNLNWFSLAAEPCAASTPITVPGKVEAENYCDVFGLTPEQTSDLGGGSNLGWADAGDWSDYRINVATAGTYVISYRVASTLPTAQIGISVNSGAVTSTTLSNTGGWQNWQTFTSTMNLSAGIQKVRLSVLQPGFNINWFDIQRVGATSSVASSAVSSSVSSKASSISSVISSSIASIASSKSSVASSSKSASSVASVVSSVSSASSISSTSSVSHVDFGTHVKVFDTSMGDAKIQSEINAIFAVQQLNHALEWGQQESSERSAIMFKPGTYNVDIPVGFYTQVLGLGASPDDVKITGKVSSEPYLTILHPEWGNNATQNFWRGIENFSTQNNSVTWAVSQSTFFRRMHVTGDLNLFAVDNSRPSWNVKSWGSGGWVSDSLITGNVDTGLQQQWFSRNSAWTGAWKGDDNNFMVFLGNGSTNVQLQTANAATSIATTPVIAEKPSLFFNGSSYEVFVPAVKTNSSGISWAAGKGAGTTLPISQFYVAKEGDSAASINAALDAGKHVLFTPGVYLLTDTIRITKANTVVLGLGFATLQPTTGKPAITVADVDGVRVAQIVVCAGPINSPQLIQVGSTVNSVSHQANPIVMSDVFVAIGGAFEGKADTAVEINSNNTIVDHAWLWRADHGNGVGWDWNKSKNGIIVNGANVTAYGLFVEHFEEFQTLWNGNGGKTYFYQSEIPYDPPYQEAWSSASGVKGWASYKVGAAVTSHEAWGLGIYTAFSTQGITMTRSVEAPVNTNVKFHNIVNAKFNDVSGGTITYVINDQQDPAGTIMGNFSNGKPRIVTY